MTIQFLRKLLLISLISGFAVYSYGQKDLKITGYAPQLPDGTEIYLLPSYPRRYYEQQERERKAIRETPSMIVKNGRFNAIIKVRNGDTYSIEVNGIKGAKRICLAEGILDVNILGTDLKDITFSGNETTAAYDRYYQNYFGSELYKAAAKARINLRISKDPDVIALSEKLLDSNGRVSRKNVTAHFQQYPNSYINAELVSSAGFSEAQKKEIFNKFSKRLTDNSYGDKLRFDIDSLFIEGYAPVFTQKDTAGNAVKLDSFRGKYVFLDFWASWCVPCRVENPNLVNAVKTYGKKNFTIIGISLDEDKKAWVEAIKADGLNWTHVSDLKKRYDNEVSINYDIYSIPANFLLDPSGKIIAKNLRGKELLEILEKVFK